MEHADFEIAIKKATGAPSMSGAKWKPLERVFAANEVRGSGALNNQEAERRTRVRQLFTTRRHPGFEGYDYSDHCVFVINQDAAARQRHEEANPPEGETYLNRTKLDVKTERPDLERGGRSVAIFRFDAETDEDGELIVSQDPEDGKTVAQGELTLLSLMVWQFDDVIRHYVEWYAIDPEMFTNGGEGARPNVALRRGRLRPPSEAEDVLLIGVDDAFDRAVAALRAGKHVLLYGPPGTGKTELAEYLCSSLIEHPPNHYSFSTATSDWTTFDTIGGYMPRPTPDGSDYLDFEAGLVTRAISEGRWLVIDEVNRADVDKAFGELFTLLAGKSVRLPYMKKVGDEWLSVFLGEPPGPGFHGIPIGADWRLIGTLNTFDKASLYRLSYAFMRRFALIHVDVPSRDDYRNLIEYFTQEALEDESPELRGRLVQLSSAIFAPDPGEGLDSIGIAVGPAIPLDVLSYCRGRLADREEAPAEEEVEAVVHELLLEGLEALLYPQFEGRDRDHAAILDACTIGLDLSQARLQATARRLSIWTGADPDQAGSV